MTGTAVYYSFTGSTEVIAKNFSEKSGFKLCKLEDREKRKSAPASASILGLGTALKEPLPDIKNVDFLVLLTPIYAWHPSAQMNTFLKNAGIGGKKLFLVGVGAGETNEKAMARFSGKVKKLGGQVAGTKAFKGVQLGKNYKEVEAALQKSGEELAKIIDSLT